MMNYMLEKTLKGNKTCVQYVKYLAKNGDKMRNNNWFLKTLLPPIEEDIACEWPQIEEQSILKDQQIYLIYA